MQKYTIPVLNPNASSLQVLKLNMSIYLHGTSLVAQWVKNLLAMWDTQVQSLGRESLEAGMATHSSILAWRIPWTEEPGGLQSMGLQRVRHDWAANDIHIYTYTKIILNIKWFVFILYNSSEYYNSGIYICMCVCIYPYKKAYIYINPFFLFCTGIYCSTWSFLLLQYAGSLVLAHRL